MTPDEETRVENLPGDETCPPLAPSGENRPPEEPLSEEEQSVKTDGALTEPSEDSILLQDLPQNEAGQGRLMDGLYQAIAKLEVVQHQLSLLSQHFDSKLKYDAHKEKVIDNLHNELQQYKDILFRNHEHSLTIDLIRVIDDIKKFAAHYRALSADKRNPEKILDYLEQIPSDMEDLFSLRGVTTYRVTSSDVDPSRQRVTQKITTRDPLRDKTIAASLRPGYECDGRVIRPEMVAVYVYESPAE